MVASGIGGDFRDVGHVDVFVVCDSLFRGVGGVDDDLEAVEVGRVTVGVLVVSEPAGVFVDGAGVFVAGDFGVFFAVSVGDFLLAGRVDDMRGFGAFTVVDFDGVAGARGDVSVGAGAFGFGAEDDDVGPVGLDGRVAEDGDYFVDAGCFYVDFVDFFSVFGVEDDDVFFGYDEVVGCVGG